MRAGWLTQVRYTVKERLYNISEQELAKQTVKRAFSSNSTMTAKERGEIMCAYFRKYVKSVTVVKEPVDMSIIFDGGLPLELPC